MALDQPSIMGGGSVTELPAPIEPTDRDWCDTRLISLDIARPRLRNAEASNLPSEWIR